MNVSIDARKYDITTCYNTLNTNAQTHPTRKHIALTFERISRTKNTLIKAQHMPFAEHSTHTITW